MRIMKVLGLGALILLCGSSALAQGRFEIQPFVGYKWGGTLDLAPNTASVARAEFASDIAYGVTATFNATPHFGLEFLWNHQPTTVSGQLGNGATFPTQVDAHLDQYHGNIVVTLTDEDSNFKPFFLVGFGATSIGADNRNGATKFSFGLGAGVKYFFSEHIGVRTQIRYAPTYVYSTYGGTYCDWWGFCWTIPDDHYLNQGDVTGGLVFRF